MSYEKQNFTEGQVLTAEALNNMDNCIAETEAAVEHISSEGGGTVVQNEKNSNSTLWSQWNKRLSFGMNTSESRVPFVVDGQMFVNGTLMLHNDTGNNNDMHNSNRWGFHVLEAYLRNNYDRWTVLVDKNTFEGKKMLEDYLYTGANHYADSYGWRKIGSDVAGHSFLFDRDVMEAYGAIHCHSPLSLARINPSTDLNSTYNTVAEADAAYEPQKFAEENMKCVKAIEIANAEDGCMYYDTEANKIKVKINGEWKSLVVAD